MNDLGRQLLAALNDTSQEGHDLRAAFGRILQNSLIDPRGNDVLKAAVAAEVPNIVQDVRDMIVNSDALHASAALWQRFQETTYEQVDKVCQERGLGHRAAKDGE